MNPESFPEIIRKTAKREAVQYEIEVLTREACGFHPDFPVTDNDLTKQGLTRDTYNHVRNIFTQLRVLVRKEARPFFPEFKHIFTDNPDLWAERVESLQSEISQIREIYKGRN